MHLMCPQVSLCELESLFLLTISGVFLFLMQILPTQHPTSQLRAQILLAREREKKDTSVPGHFFYRLLEDSVHL